ncbi:MAG: UDP-N-acetylmuramate--L-alanine ligase [Actinobacteria bacterium]|nr:UDP-N-acetylmuramate--L-alanine ligase [Actinomycetota bacterium]
MIKPDYSQPVPNNLGKVHFVGIGGSGMSGLARLLLGMGHEVSGSDVRGSDNITALEALGAKITIGHDANNLGNADTVVVTSALWPNNPEYVLAKEKGLPVLHRSAMLAHLASRGKLIAVAGAHGKTTSTGMVVTGLDLLGADPSFVNGGVIQAYGASSAFGTGEHFVIEADESDSSFLHYDTDTVLITNVDPDHLDHFGSLEAFEGEFVKFAEAAKNLVVISSDDPGAVRVRTKLSHPRVLTFGERPDADVRVTSIDASGPKVSFELAYLGEKVALQLIIPGAHNAINAAGAVAVLVGHGFDFVKSAHAVSSFEGTVRRFELHGERRGVKVYDDFAHHPTEVVAALKAARAAVGSGKIITVFQPHLYSRTRIFAQEFADALALSDQVVVMDIYAAREDPEPGVTGALISDRFSDQSKVHYVPLWKDTPAVAAKLAESGDFIMTMGCGDVYKMVPELLEALEQ